LKINVGNNDYFKNMENFSLKRIQKKGKIIAATFALGLSLYGCNQEPNKNSEIEAMMQTFSADVSLEDVNDMNIIIWDKDCSDTFFNDVCCKLSDDGLNFKIAKNEDEVNEDNSVVLSLDQQYSSGSDTIIFAPYNNTRVGYSDSLALSMQAAFKQNGFLGNNICCGKIGYREDENGNVCTVIPTEVEEALDEDSDTSFVTISFGTENVNSDWVAKSIENGLARQNYYLNNYDSGTDLIYRASQNDSMEVVADYFDSNVVSLNGFNNIKDGIITDSQAIINPHVNNMSVFDSKAQFSIDTVKTKAY